MPKCFLAKKLRYPYEQWKENNEDTRTYKPATVAALSDKKHGISDKAGNCLKDDVYVGGKCNLTE